MKAKTVEKRKNFAYVLLILSSFFLYIILTGSKNLYVAEKTTFETLGTFGNLIDLSMTMQYYFYAYAAMQIILIFIIKKINVKWFLTATIGISAILTIAVAFTDSISQHYVIFIINGFMQAGIWGCLLKYLSASLPMRYLPFANKLMSCGPAVSGIISYGTAAMFGEEWKIPFIVLGAILLLAVGLYFFSSSYVKRFPKDEDELVIVKADGTREQVKPKEENDFIHLDSKLRVIVFYIVAALMSFFVTSLFFMLNNNIDMFFKEIGGLTNDEAKLVTILVPISIVVGPIFTVSLCEKHKNFILVAAVLYGISACLALLNVFLFDFNIVISIILLLAFLIIANGARTITLSIVALRMRNKIDTGAFSTTANVTASLASGIAPSVLAAIINNESLSPVENWRASFLTIFCLNVAIVIAILGIALWVHLINRKRPPVDKTPD